jgi:hypothetical protein
MSRQINEIMNPLEAEVLNENIQKRENNAKLQGRLKSLQNRRNRLG